MFDADFKIAQLRFENISCSLVLNYELPLAYLSFLFALKVLLWPEKLEKNACANNYLFLLH